MIRITTLFLVATFLLVLVGVRAYATYNEDKPEKVYICHCSENHCETLHLPVVSALSHLKHHEADYRGECKQEETPTPTINPCLQTEYSLVENDCVTPSPEITPESTPSATPTKYEPPSPHGDGLSDGKSDGRSDGRSSAPQPTLVPCSQTNCGWK